MLNEGTVTLSVANRKTQFIQRKCEVGIYLMILNWPFTGKVYYIFNSFYNLFNDFV